MGHSDRYDDALPRASRPRPATSAGDLRAAWRYADIRDAADLLRADLRRDRRPGRLRLVRAAGRAGVRRRRARSRRPQRLTETIGKDNVLIKVPGHRRGRGGVRGADRARRQREHDAAVRRRALPRDRRGLRPRRSQRRVDAGEPVDRAASVASFFVSRVDTQGRRRARASSAARTCAARPRSPTRRIAYAAFERDLLAAPRVGRLARAGAQRAAAAVGLDVDQEPRLPGHALRRRADRPGHGQHHARRDDRGRARPRDARRARSTRTSRAPTR